ncbi:MAG: hypothetical protein HHJ11_07745 [Phycicoccus sp.]|nr:hypothetical protein [Phycicoccus sp.]NMM35390.1 hypothetical protein [Phycicoccus sp.]
MARHLWCVVNGVVVTRSQGEAGKHDEKSEHCCGRPRAIHPLGSHPDLGGKPRDHRGDDHPVRPRPDRSVPVRPRRRDRPGTAPEVTTSTGAKSAAETTDPGNWTNRLRGRIEGLVPPGEALPDRQPIYVASWIYVFGVLTLSSLAVVILSGCVLAVGGVQWWHVSSLGHYVNSVHLWSVELFFGFMVIHLWGKFWMAAWRGKRAMTWVSGVLLFGISIGTSFTGFLSQTNFSAQWIAGEGKDGINSTGAGAFFNVLNPGQMLLWHVVLLPLVVVLIVLIHIIQVRRHGVVPPLDADLEG